MGHAFLCIKYPDEVSWGWRTTVRVYSDLGRTAGRLAAVALRVGLRRSGRDGLEAASFELLYKLAQRAGFARQALSQGYVYL
jgi:hypothetical protein